MGIFRAYLGRWLELNWPLGIWLIVLFGAPRFALVLDANVSGSYQQVSLIFILMWLFPLIMLNKEGRFLIGLRKPKNLWWLPLSLLLGILGCLVVYFLGNWFYGASIDNWLVYISRTYSSTLPLDWRADKTVYFAIYAFTSMIFSPLGEEFMYRGLIHQCFVNRLGENGASIVDSAAFAIVHLAHFGILYTGTGWSFHLLPAMIWLILMFFASRLFFYCKLQSRSLYAAVVAHAGFNLAMTYFIFYHIL